MTLTLTLPKWYDLHAHFRQDDILPATVKDHIDMGCAGILAMPNTKPPVACVLKSDETDARWSIETYREQLDKAADGAFEEIIVPLYLTRETTPEMIEQGAKSGLLKACKYYPPHGTTGAEFGAPLDHYMQNGVLKALEENGVTLCLHGEQHAMDPENYFGSDSNAEHVFYTEHMPRLIEAYPKLNITGEHITTKTAADFIASAPAHVKASITPQHLLYTVGHLLQGCNYHLYCLPLVKFEEDRAALRKAATDPNNTKFFAGTDSAPHTQKCTPCGCAAGCYTGAIAPQLYAEGFERAGIDLSTEQGAKIFQNFLCDIGPEHYGIAASSETFTLTKSPQVVEAKSVANHTIIPLPLGMSIEGGDGKTSVEINWSISK